MANQCIVPQRLRRPENLEIQTTYAKRTTTVNNYRNPNASQTLKIVPVKIMAVNKAYFKVREVSAEFKVPCVKKAFGEGIVRVRCRTIQQLDNIAAILKELMLFDFIMEIGMPVEYSYKMKSLVLFIKPKDKEASNIIANLFETNPCRYRYLIVETEDPSVSAEKFLKELTKEVAQILKDATVQADMEKQTCTSDLPKNMNDSVQEGGQPATNIQNGPNEQERLEAEKLFYSRLLKLLKICVLLLSLYNIWDPEEE
jgi:hypothetical protein